MSMLPHRARRRFEADPRSVALARRFARLQLEEWGAPELCDSAALVVSELVTNAVVHTGTTPVLDLSLDAHTLRIEVEDKYPGRALPTGLVVPSDDSEEGRGLLITSALGSSWGVEYTAESKRVWLVCDRQSAPRRDPSPARTTRPPTARGTAVAVVEVDTDGRVATWNRDATRLFGWESGQVLGQPFHQLVDPAASVRPPESTTLPGGTWQGVYSVLAADGTPVSVFASHAGGAGSNGTALLLVEESQRALLEHPESRVTSHAPRPDSDPLGLRDDALLRLGVDDYLQLATERVRDILVADAAYLLIGHEVDDVYEVVAASGLPASVRGTAVSAGDPGAPHARTPHLPVRLLGDAVIRAKPLAGTNARSLATVPVVAEGRVIGALTVASEHRDGFTDDQCVLLQRLADSLALATDRARLQTSERERRGWLTFIAEAGDLLAHSLDRDMTMAITGQIVVPRLATWCALHLDDERGKPVLQQVWHTDENAVDDLRQALLSAGLDGLEDSTDDVLAGSVTRLRLLARGRGIGHLTLGRATGGPLRDDMLLVAESVARRAALAIDNAHAHGALLATGQALQRSLLPQLLPSVPGLDVGVVYQAAGEGAAAGGDFYDLFPIDGGNWCFVVGDVCGAGAEAAAVTGLARHTIRSLIRAGLPVAATLERLNAAILEEGDRSRFLTLLCGTFSHGQGRLNLSLVNAGHPAAFVASGHGQVRRVGRPQLLLGVMDKVEYEAEACSLERGELLVVLTDGVLERRSGNRMIDDDGVADDLTRVGALPAQAVAERLRQLVVDFAEVAPSDDMAILALRFES